MIKRNLINTYVFIITLCPSILGKICLEKKLDYNEN